MKTQTKCLLMVVLAALSITTRRIEEIVRQSLSHALAESKPEIALAV